MTPKFKHDCDNCILLGCTDKSDMYYCTRGPLGGSAIVRFSDDGPDYTSVPISVAKTMDFSQHPELLDCYELSKLHWKSK
jgi:hypothetical protein